jgi:hypothetical protein
MEEPGVKEPVEDGKHFDALQLSATMKGLADEFVTSSAYGKICISCYIGKHEACEKELLVSLTDKWEVKPCQCNENNHRIQSFPRTDQPVARKRYSFVSSLLYLLAALVINSVQIVFWGGMGLGYIYIVIKVVKYALTH